MYRFVKSMKKKEALASICEALEERGYEHADWPEEMPPGPSQERMYKYMNRLAFLKYVLGGKIRRAGALMVREGKLAVIKLITNKELVERIIDMAFLADNLILALPIPPDALDRITFLGYGEWKEEKLEEKFKEMARGRKKPAEGPKETGKGARKGAMRAGVEMQLECPKCGREKTVRTEMELPGEIVCDGCDEKFGPKGAFVKTLTLEFLPERVRMTYIV